MRMNYRTKDKCSLILTVLGGAGVIVTAVLTAHETPKAIKLINQAKDEKDRALTISETVITCLPAYIPAIISGITTITCIFGITVLSRKSQASLASAYTLLNQSYKNYKCKLIELYGKDAHDKIIEQLAVENANEIYGYGEYLCSITSLELSGNKSKKILFYDAFSERYFATTPEQVLSAEYYINRNYALRGYATLNELYDFYGIAPISGGDELGWAPTDEGEYWIEFNHIESQLSDKTSFYIIEMPFEPRVNYDNYY